MEAVARWLGGCVGPARLLGALVLVSSAGCQARWVQRAAPPEPPADERPSWLPEYSPAQQALLAPSRDPVAVPARPTYPVLDEFLHGAPRRLEDPRDALEVTRLVAELIERSPRSYALSDATPELANLVAQYGPSPTAEQDLWAQARRDAFGNVHLVRLAPPPAALEALAEGARTEALGDDVAAKRAYLRAAELAGREAAAPKLALARLTARSSSERAEALYEEVLALDPTLARAHEGIAELRLARGEKRAALESLARALAYHPPSPSSARLAERVAGEDLDPARPEPYEIFLEVDPMGEIRVGSLPTPGARMYAGCRAVMRYERELRRTLFERPENAPYVLSAAEEMLCIESAIGAYIAERVSSRQRGEPSPSDEQTHALLELAHTEGLLGYVMFEILGRHRPEHARTAPMAVHLATMAYVLEHVLGAELDRERDRYTASR
jgi:tetratricopeptide (TPR) repeat protein